MKQAGLAVLFLLYVPFPATCQRVHIASVGGPAWISRLAAADGALTSAAAGPRGRRVTAELQAEDATALGVEAGWNATPRLTVRLSAGHLATAMELAVVATLPEGTDPISFDFQGLGDVTLWLLDAGVVWRPLPSREPDDGDAARPAVDPYLSVAAGAARWDIRGLEALVQLSLLAGDVVGLRPVTATLPAGSVAVGADIRLFRRVAGRLELADHLGADPLDDEDFALGRYFAGTVDPENVVHTLRASVGVSVEVW